MIAIKEKKFNNKFMDGKTVKVIVDAKKIQILGERDARDDEIEKSLKQAKKKEENSNKELPKEVKKEKTNLILKDLESSEKLSNCIGREIKLAVNSEQVLNKH